MKLKTLALEFDIIQFRHLTLIDLTFVCYFFLKPLDSSERKVPFFVTLLFQCIASFYFKFVLTTFHHYDILFITLKSKLVSYVHNSKITF